MWKIKGIPQENDLLNLGETHIFLYADKGTQYGDLKSRTTEKCPFI